MWTLLFTIVFKVFSTFVLKTLDSRNTVLNMGWVFVLLIIIVAVVFNSRPFEFPLGRNLSVDSTNW